MTRLSQTRKPSGLTAASLPAGELKDAASSLQDTLNAKSLSAAAIKDILAKGDSGLEPAILQALLARAEGKSPNGPGQSVAAVRAQGVLPKSDEVQRVEAALNDKLIGQKGMKAATLRFIEARETALENLPQALGVTGPPGVGKTQLARALAFAYHGDESKFVHLKGETLTDKASISRIKGASKKYVGYEKEDDSLLLAPGPIKRMFGGKSPVIICLDELDKIGQGLGEQAQQDLIAEVLNFFNAFLENGRLELDNNEVTEAADAILIITANAGSKEAQHLTGKQAVDVFTEKFKELLPPHMQSRLPNIAVAESLTPAETAQIASKNLREGLQVAEAKVRKESGNEISIVADEKVTKLMGDLGFSPKFGARPMENIIKLLLHPIISAGIRNAEDGEQYTLQLKPGRDAASLETEMRKLHDAFMETAPGIPESVTASNFPVQMVCTNPKPAFFEYEGNIPMTPDMAVLASGVVGGRGFMFSSPAPGEANQLHLLQAGRNEASDRYRAINNVPDALSNASHAKVAQLDDNTLMFYGVTTGDADEPEAKAFLFDSTTSTFTEATPPPVSLADASFGAVGNSVLLTGGREVYKDGGDWMPPADPRELPGNAIEAQSYVYSRHDDTWTKIDSGTQTPRSGAAVVRANDALYIIGGEETALTSDGVPYTVASNKVDIFREDDMAIKEGVDLPFGVAHATAYEDRYGRVRLAGGTDFHDFGREVEFRSSHLSLDPKNDSAKWKANDKLPVPSAQVAVIPHVSGRVMGPMFNDAGEPGFQILK